MFSFKQFNYNIKCTFLNENDKTRGNEFEFYFLRTQLGTLFIIFFKTKLTCF